MSLKTYYCKRVKKNIGAERINDKVFVICEKYHNESPKSEFATNFNCFKNFWVTKKCLIRELLEEEQISQEEVRK